MVAITFHFKPGNNNKVSVGIFANIVYFGKIPYFFKIIN